MKLWLLVAIGIELADESATAVLDELVKLTSSYLSCFVEHFGEISANPYSSAVVVLGLASVFAVGSSTPFLRDHLNYLSFSNCCQSRSTAPHY